MTKHLPYMTPQILDEVDGGGLMVSTSAPLTQPDLFFKMGEGAGATETI